ncbi:MAG: MFS transporter [Bifidobacteriaceae bacterium]|jgi:MFS family permease|nr:MFS transporter [Bifidobacteriaceae bacterium]
MPRNVWILAGIGLAVAIGFGVVNPVLPVFAASFGVNELAAAAVVSAFALMRLVFAPAVGPLTDRWGHRFVLLAGVLIVAVSSLAVGYARSYAQMIVFRGLGGLGSAMFSVSAMTILLSSVDADRRGRASAVYQGSFLVGAVAGPALGGLFGAISLRAPFFFYSITLGAAAAVSLGLAPITGDRPLAARPDRTTPGAAAGAAGSAAGVSVPDEQAGNGGLDSPGGPVSAGDGGADGVGRGPSLSEGEDGGDRTASGGVARPLREVVRDRRYQAALLAHLAQGWNTNGTRGALIPLFVAAYLAADESQAVLWAGIAMSVGAIVQVGAIWPSGVVVDRIGRRGPMVIGALVAAGAMAALPISRSLAVLAAVLSVYAIGAALIGTAPAAAVGDAAGPGGTRAIALYSMAGDTGSVVGPLVAGYLAAHFSYVTACAAGALLWLASALVSAAMRRPGADRRLP